MAPSCLLRIIAPSFLFGVAVLAQQLLLLPTCHSFLPPGTVPQRRRHTSITQAFAVKKQLIEFQEPTTGVTVKLVGCMHYNPASIQLTQDTIQQLAQQNKLGAVIIESCDIRWGKTNELPEPIQKLLKSEMKAAVELADEYQRPVVLGDQRINITVNSLGQGLKETAIDLATPWNGGWRRFASNVTAAKAEALPSGNNNEDYYLNAFAFLDPALILAAPISLIKYPMSYLFRSPLATIAFFTLLFLSEQPSADAATTVMTTTMIDPSYTLGDWVGSLAGSALEIALFARIFLKELLVDRNKLLARNILEQCRLYQSTSTSSPATTTSGSRKNLFSNIFGAFRGSKRQKQQNNDDGFEVIYVNNVSESPQDGEQQPALRNKTPWSDDNDDGNDGMAVVAVLGMAHCNGIAKLLKEELV